MFGEKCFSQATDETRRLCVQSDLNYHLVLNRKSQKLIQYSIKIYLLLHANIMASRVLRRPSQSRWELSLFRRLTSTASGLSFARSVIRFRVFLLEVKCFVDRKCLLLFN